LILEDLVFISFLQRPVGLVLDNRMKIWHPLGF